MAGASSPTEHQDEEIFPNGDLQNRQQIEGSSSDSQSLFGKTLTLKTPDPSIPFDFDGENQYWQAEKVAVERETEPEGQPSTQEEKIEEDDADMPSSSLSETPSISRRGGGPRRKKVTQKQRAAEKKSQEKFKVLVETLNPIPFAPVRTLDFSKHETLLKRLGLWDFVHLDFERNIKNDLVAQLIASYNSISRCSYVNGSRINVSRADLARALKLPVKREKLVISDEEKNVIESEESMEFLEEFVSIWVLLHGEDTWMMPDEVVEWKKFLKERNFEKLDWAGLFWCMVEKELTAAPQLCDCYYASHLQSLIKCQKEELLTEEPENENELDVKEVDAQEEDDGGLGEDNMVDRAEEMKEEQGSDEHNVELNLGQESVLKTVLEGEHNECEQVMDVEESKEEEREGWVWNSNSNMTQHFLRPCSRESDVHVMDCDNEKEIEDDGQENGEEEVEKHGGIPLFPSNDSLDGVAHENIIGEMGEGSPMAFTAGLQIRNASVGEFLGSRADIHLMPGNSALFTSCSKREIDHNSDVSDHVHVSKRLRADEPSWNDKQQFDFDVCMQHVHQWIGKARVSYAEKERAFAESSYNQQVLINELQRKDSIVQGLEKIHCEELHRKDMEIYKLESELRLMVNVLDGYRKALKKTQQAFKEHREQCQMHEEPLYKDVKGSRGLVLSAVEVENLRQKQEEEDRLKLTSLERKMKELEDEWLGIFSSHGDNVCALGTRLSDIEKQVNLLKEYRAKRKIADTQEPTSPPKN